VPRYWQHATPLRCPKRHTMTWLGSAYWICSTCKTVFVQQAPRLHAQRGTQSAKRLPCSHET